MFDKTTWYERHPDLQRPLKVKPVKKPNARRPRRHFTVRAVYYDRSGQKPIVRISKAFQGAVPTASQRVPKCVIFGGTLIQ
jgi:hypothetical protein